MKMGGRGTNQRAPFQVHAMQAAVCAQKSVRGR